MTKISRSSSGDASVNLSGEVEQLRFDAEVEEAAQRSASADKAGDTGKTNQNAMHNPRGKPVLRDVDSRYVDLNPSIFTADHFRFLK